jgi:hypothetical protein
MSTTTTTPTTEQVWAERLDAEQLAARLIAYSKVSRWGPEAQRTALLKEAARRLFDGEPVLGKAPLPTKREMAEATGEPEPADAGGTPEIRVREIPADEVAARRQSKSGDPRTDRAARTAHDQTDALVLAHLRSYPPGEDIALERITAGIKELLPLVKLRPSLKRLVSSLQVLDHGGKYQAAIPAIDGSDEHDAAVKSDD